MAMGKCRECGKEASSEAKACPHCGASKPVTKTTATTKLIGGIFALMIAMWIFKSNEAPSTPAAPAPTAQQIAAKARKEAAFQKTVATVKALKKSLRDPESMALESVRADDDANIICVEYRAKNGFGGMNREHLILAHGKVTQGAEAWNKICTQPLLDMKHVKHAL